MAAPTHCSSVGPSLALGARGGLQADAAERASLLPREFRPRQPSSWRALAVGTACCLSVAVLGVGTLSIVHPALHSALASAGRRALGGGVSGAIAGAAQVLTLMWLRTAMNYQYRHGGGLGAALRAIYAQGGVARFYEGVGFALIQNPLSRFGDTAANSGVLALFDASSAGATIPLGARTALASSVAALWRICITPLDTCKTTLQVEGRAAYGLLLRKAQRDGPLTM